MHRLAASQPRSNRDPLIRTHRPMRLLLGLALLSAAALAADANWPQFRGAQAAGVAEGHALPSAWDVAKNEGVRWKTPIAGLAHSSPVIWGEKLFVTTAVSSADNQSLRTGLFGEGDSADDMTEHAFKVLCLDKKTGKILWEKTAHTGVPKVKRHVKATHVNCTPAVDAQHVIVFFASEGLYCFSHDGELKWSKDLGVLDVGPYNAMQMEWGFASSPVLIDGKAIVQCDIKKNAFLAAFDASDGRELWRTPRADVPTWATPTAWMSPGGPQIICNGCLEIGAYDANTGKRVWSLSGGGGIPVPAPVLGDGLVYLTSNHRPYRAQDPSQPVFAVGLNATGELSVIEGPAAAPDPHVKWVKTKIGSYMQTPLLYGGRLYVCKDNGTFRVLDAKTGEEKWTQRIGGGNVGFTASAIAGDGKIYYTAEDGKVIVLKAGGEGEPIATNDLGESCLATPAISEGVIYWRTRGHVIAIGK